MGNLGCDTIIQNDVLKTLEFSMINSRPVEIIYNGEKEFSQRKIKVVQIQEDTIVAYCYLRKGRRKFKIDHILSAQMVP